MPSPSPLQGRGAGTGGRAEGEAQPLPPLPTLSPEGERAITLAAIAGAHGITGEVRLKLFGEGLASLKPHKSFNGGKLTLAKLRDDGKGGAIARFAEVADRTAAENLRGTTLTVPREALPPLAAGEYYHTDLLGLPAVTDTGEPLGQVCAVENFGAGDVVEIQRLDGKRFMVPMRAEAVPEWDANRLVVSAQFAED
jgi:16S rRNA processing protein RimM